MKLNLLSHLSFLSLFFLFAFARPRAQQAATQLFRRQYLDELIERDLESDIELLRRALRSSLDRYHGFGGPALKAHEEPPLPAFDPRLYKTTNALTPATPPSPPPPPPADHPAEKHPEPLQLEKVATPVTPPVLPEIHPLSPLTPGFPESDDHYASDKSSGSASSIVDRRKKPARGGRSHAHPHGKRDDAELAAPLFLQAKLGGRDVDELEDFFDYF